MSYSSIHTLFGLELIADAEVNSTTINLTHIAVGDGNGNAVVPSESMTALVREVYRGTANRVYKPDAVGDPTHFIAEMIIPASEGGFVMREVGVFTADGDLFTVGNLPETYKPEIGEGAYSDTVVRVHFIVTNADVITLQVDPSVSVASQSWVLNNITVCHLMPGGTTGQVLKKASNACGDVAWGDPDVTDVVVDIVEEEQTLAAAQVTVNWATVTNNGLSVYIEGLRIKRGTGVNEWQAAAAPNDLTRITLGQSYPAGTKIVGVQNEPLGSVMLPLVRANNLSDLASASTARTNLDVYSRAETDQKAPAGAVMAFARNSAPTGWLKCNGAAISRTTYSALFSAIGTTFGTGNGSTTFNVPDLRGEFIRGWDDGRGIDVGRTFGSYQADEFKYHEHPLQLRLSGSDGGEVSSVGVQGDVNDDATVTMDYPNNQAKTAGGVETRPRNRALLYCIKY